MGRGWGQIWMSGGNSRLSWVLLIAPDLFYPINDKLLEWDLRQIPESAQVECAQGLLARGYLSSGTLPDRGNWKACFCLFVCLLFPCTVRMGWFQCPGEPTVCHLCLTLSTVASGKVTYHKVLRALTFALIAILTCRKASFLIFFETGVGLSIGSVEGYIPSSGLVKWLAPF